MRVGVMMGSRFKDKVPERKPFGDSSVAKRRMRDEESGVAAERGEEPRGRVKRQGSSELHGGKVKASGKKRGQPKAG